MNDDTDLSRAQKRQLREQKRDVQEMLQSIPARRFLRRMIDVSGVFRDDADPGMRRMGLWLIAEINNADRRAFPQMMMEAVTTDPDLTGEHNDDY